MAAPKYFCYGCGRFQNITKVDIWNICNHFVDNERPVKHCICRSCKRQYPNTKIEDLPRAIKVDHIHNFLTEEEVERNIKKLQVDLANIFAKYKDVDGEKV